MKKFCFLFLCAVMLAGCQTRIYVSESTSLGPCIRNIADKEYEYIPYDESALLHISLDSFDITPGEIVYEDSASSLYRARGAKDHEVIVEVNNVSQEKKVMVLSLSNFATILDGMHYFGIESAETIVSCGYSDAFQGDNFDFVAARETYDNLSTQEARNVIFEVLSNLSGDAEKPNSLWEDGFLLIKITLESGLVIPMIYSESFHYVEIPNAGKNFGTILSTEQEARLKNIILIESTKTE